MNAMRYLVSLKAAHDEIARLKTAIEDLEGLINMQRDECEVCRIIKASLAEESARLKAVVAAALTVLGGKP